MHVPSTANIFPCSYVYQVVIGHMTAVLTAEHTTAYAEGRIALLYDAHHQRLYRLVRRLCRNPDESRDLLQETFLRAARSHRSIPHGAASEEAWLVRVLINIRRDEWRKTARRKQLDADPDGQRPHESSDAEATLIARITIWKALDRLPPRRRAIIVLHQLEGATISAIAELLGVTMVTVRWHLMKGRRELAEIIRGSQGNIR